MYVVLKKSITRATECTTNFIHLGMYLS
jgi:hypothetical protein